MPARIISVVNQKGGCGKTATVFEIGKILSKDYKVLFIDLDGQGDLTRVLTDETSEIGALDFITGTSPDRIIIHLSDEVDLIPSTPELNSADRALLDRRGYSVKLLGNRLKRIVNDYDYILIDTPPKLGTLNTLAIGGADVVLIPTLAENNSIDGVMNLLNYTYRGIADKYPGTAPIGGIVVNRYRGRSIISKSMYEAIESIGSQIGAKVYPVKDTVKLQEAHFYRKSITEYAPKSDTSKQLSMLVNDIIGKE